MTIEELKYDMYEQLAAIRKARKHPIMLRNFEDDLEKYLEALRYEHAVTCESLHEATAKLASKDQSIDALHLAIKSAQEAHASLQGLFNLCESIRNKEQAEFYRQIMAAETISDWRWELLEKRQELIVSQRKAIESLTFEIASMRKRNEKSSFWRLFCTKTHESKPLPKK